MGATGRYGASLLAAIALGACSYAPTDERGLAHGETLLSVSATGQADTTPDEAQFQAGMESFGTSAKAASEANAAAIEEVIAALRALDIPDADIQTRTVGITRIRWGDRKGQYQASNVVNVTIRDIAQAGAAVTSVSEAGANILSGPDLRLADPEAAANTAYTAAYAAARARAQAYADAADMEISRVLYIRDAGGVQGGRYFAGAQAIELESSPAMPPPVSAQPRPESANFRNTVMAGQTSSTATVQVDFALLPK